MLYAVAATVMATGLAAVFTEIGRKLRFLYALRRPQSSWMSREVYAAAIFFPAVLVAWYWPHPSVHAVIGLAATAFLYCQSQIPFAAKGIPAWRIPLTVWLFFASALLEGTALLAIAAGVLAPAVSANLAIATAGAVLAAVNAGLWSGYRHATRQRRVPPAACEEIERITPWLHVVGHGVPAALFIAAFAWRSTDAALPLLAGAGLAALAGSAMWKVTLITRAGYQQGFALPKWPQRGSGTRAAPRRLTVSAPS